MDKVVIDSQIDQPDELFLEMKLRQSLSSFGSRLQFVRLILRMKSEPGYPGLYYRCDLEGRSGELHTAVGSAQHIDVAMAIERTAQKLRCNLTLRDGLDL